MNRPRGLAPPLIRTRLALLLLIVVTAFTVVACGNDDDDGDSGSPSATAKADSCSKGQLALVNSGVLTVGTDKPAFPPYFEDDDPTNGKGFESAVAYGVAKNLGFSKADVKWTVVPFNSSYARDRSPAGRPASPGGLANCTAIGQRSSGAPAASPIHLSVICFSSPLDSSFPRALFTQGVSFESFSSSMPNESPPGALNWPMIFEPGTCAAVM